MVLVAPAFAMKPYFINPAALTDLGKLCVQFPQFVERDITGDGQAETFCNFSVATAFRIATGRGDLHGPDGRPRSANDIAGIVASSPDWVDVPSLADAQELANRGAFLVSAVSSAPHGHVVFHVPGKLEYSSTYGRFVGQVANVGPSRWQGIVKFSFAFKPAPVPMTRIYSPQPVTL